MKDEVHFLFALGNERTRDQCPFISQCKQKSVLQSLNKKNNNSRKKSVDTKVIVMQVQR